MSENLQIITFLEIIKELRLEGIEHEIKGRAGTPKGSLA